MTKEIANILGSDVSRETIQALEAYLALLKKWSPKINLVAQSTLGKAWERHILDSAQIFPLIGQSCAHHLDIGSGAGFPGLICAVLAKQYAPERQHTLVESDQRKCAFLRTVARETGVQATILAERIEAVPTVGADIVSARALADLTDLLSIMNQHGGEGCLGLFPKGQNWQAEIERAHQKWRFRYDSHASITNENAAILAIRELSHV